MPALMDVEDEAAGEEAVDFTNPSVAEESFFYASEIIRILLRELSAPKGLPRSFHSVGLGPEW